MNLYVAFLGGSLDGNRMGEDHEVVFVVADDGPSAKSQAKTKWGGAGKCHVDAIQRLEMVDGFEVALTQTGTGDRTVLDDFN